MVVLSFCRCFSDGGGGFLVDDDDNPVGKVMAWSYPITSAALAAWQVLGVMSMWLDAEHPHHAARVLTANGFAWLISANVILSCTSLVAFCCVFKLKRDRRRRFLMPPVLSSPVADSGATFEDLTLRTFTIGKDGASDFGSTHPCAICLTACGEGDRLKELYCGHVFHMHCINTWLSSGRANKCPMRCVTRSLAPVLETSVWHQSVADPDAAVLDPELRETSNTFTFSV